MVNLGHNHFCDENEKSILRWAEENEIEQFDFGIINKQRFEFSIAPHFIEMTTTDSTEKLLGHKTLEKYGFDFDFESNEIMVTVSKL